MWNCEEDMHRKLQSGWFLSIVCPMLFIFCLTGSFPSLSRDGDRCSPILPPLPSPTPFHLIASYCCYKCHLSPHLPPDLLFLLHSKPHPFHPHFINQVNLPITSNNLTFSTLHSSLSLHPSSCLTCSQLISERMDVMICAARWQDDVSGSASASASASPSSVAVVGAGGGGGWWGEDTGWPSEV